MSALISLTRSRELKLLLVLIIICIGPGRFGPPKMSRDTSRCVQVVPHLGGAEMTMSPSRSCRASQRRLSLIHERYSIRPAVGGVMAFTVGRCRRAFPRR